MSLPLLIEAKLLNETQDYSNLRIIDLCKPDQYLKMHIPHAVHLDYPQIVRSEMPTHGLLPEMDHLENLFSGLGIEQNTHVIAYDDEGGGKAARLLWTLDCVGHHSYSLLNGGWIAWQQQGLPVSDQVEHPTPTQFVSKADNDPIADRNYILTHLKQDKLTLIDARSAAEYNGLKKFSEKAGHIPGAINLDWMELFDPNDQCRLRPTEYLLSLFERRGIKGDDTFVVYCQTHHRSALNYFVLKLLGKTKVKGYPGSWSDWGNASDTPVEV